MNTRTLKIGALLFCMVGPLLAAAAPQPRPASTKAPTYDLSGPYTHQNLSIFLIHGRDRLAGRKLLSLSEALIQKKIKVHETGQVNELLVENYSDDDIFIHSGDIVKGGKQDRTFPEDCVLPAHSGKIPLPAFCVEEGRWQKRGVEADSYFAANYSKLSSKELKIAARHEQEQDKVWRAVSGVIGGVAALASPGSARPSSTSLQVNLENPNLKQAMKPYLEKLLPAGDRGDVIGYAFSINGELNSADIYASHTLFRKLWPALLESSVIEAVSKRGNSVSRQPAGTESVKSLLADTTMGKMSTKNVGNRTLVTKKESERNLFFESRDRQDQDNWIHRSYLTKSRESK